ncbi:uncharacterized protein A1O9_09562 [Exophiala aquamarina CBS 119918]|uniref:Uncharacterized protein n=1 Tax=Exophiala aquamarina CBS 119918 TaxID=1182545 RepID=A0A072P3I0_9EURO|nr:uncharacterized protein A1O9_09562 [Exophiala aquamarina CBS 119918]KEF54396.1 hypothetical protein A1O9_09562 [Exophiala aquamarina CBS 119918]
MFNLRFSEDQEQRCLIAFDIPASQGWFSFRRDSTVYPLNQRAQASETGIYTYRAVSPQGNEAPEPKERVDFAVDAWDVFEAADKEYRDGGVVIAFGKRFISTLDLVFMLRHAVELNSYDRSTFYTPKVGIGYIDRPFSKEFERFSKASKLAEMHQ